MSNVKRLSTRYSYSSAVKAGDFVFLGLHRGFGDSFSEQMESAFDYLEETLEEFGLTLRNLVKINVWLKNINDLPEMEKIIYQHFVKDQFPARMTSTTEFIDGDCLLMIDGTAYTQE